MVFAAGFSILPANVRRSPAAGFTLVEMAIALSIIAVVLVAVLQGRELIANAEYKSFKRELSEYAEAFYAFRERYNALPGDFAAADERLHPDLPGTANQGNGLIDDGPKCSSDGEEACLTWRHLRAASLIGGHHSETGEDARPAHPYSGSVSGFFTAGHDHGEFGHKLLVEDLPADVAHRLDDDVDDGRCDSGRISALGTGDCNDEDWTGGADNVADLVYTL